MATEFVVPELGENVEKADVGRVLVKIGDVIAKDQAVVELETDKATVEVPSSVAGKITEIKIKQGEKVKVGQVVLIVEGNGAAPASAAAAPDAATAGKPAPASAATASDAAMAGKAADTSATAGKASAKPAEVVDIASARASVSEAPAPRAAASA